jgi:hypothetical protein
MPRGEFVPYTTRRVPLIDVGFVDAVERGRVHVRPALERLTQADAVFAGGTSEPFDAIIAATGFTSGSNRSSRWQTFSMTSANRAALPVSPRRTQACISSGSRTACAGISSKQTVRPDVWRGTSSDI